MCFEIIWEVICVKASVKTAVKAAVGIVLALGCLLLNFSSLSFADRGFDDVLPEAQATSSDIFHTFVSTTQSSITTAAPPQSTLTTRQNTYVTSGSPPVTLEPVTVTTCITSGRDKNEPITSVADEVTVITTQKEQTVPRTEAPITTPSSTSPITRPVTHTTQQTTTRQTTTQQTTTQQTTTQQIITQPPDVEGKDMRTPITEEIRGIWVATVYRLDYPSAAHLTAEQLKNEVCRLVDDLAEYDFNAIYFQVRPTSDALYDSRIFPSSHWITGEQGAPYPEDFDILEYLIEYAHSKNVAVHAWINPYRVTNSTSMKLSADNPASLHPEWTFNIDGLTYYDPGIPAVTELIVSGVAEIVENYDVDGIIFDDYFYPGSSELQHSDPSRDVDYATYQRYGKDFSNIGDWRRSNINNMIKTAFERIKSIKSSCLFGVAPTGIWNNKSEEFPNGSDTSGRSAYQKAFCDALAWANGRYVDYISPQIYWSTENKSAPFETVALWWQEALRDSGTQLIISYNVYSLDASQTAAQVELARRMDNYFGYIFYNYNNIYSNAERLQVITELGVHQLKKDE